MDVEKIAQDAINQISERIKNLSTLNIIVAGKTGVGKSTLINAVFKDKLAETGIGKPVTEHMKQLTKKDVPLTIYDTRGFELGHDVQRQVKEEVISTINDGYISKDINKTIHCIWYCINTASNRVEPEEIEWIKDLSKNDRVTQIPIIIVLTQAFSKKNAEMIKKLLMDENLNVVQIIPVLAEDYEIDEDYTVRSYGLDTLIRVMGEALPDELIETLQNVQIASLAEKKRRAQKAIATAITLSTAEAAVPVPFADCAMLIPTQMTMLTTITILFGFNVNKTIIASFLSSTLGSGGATILGKTIVSGIIKLIPGAGSIAGAAISASTAGIITAALGEAYLKIMEMVFLGEMKIDELGTKSGKEKMSSFFKSALKRKRIEE